METHYPTGTLLFNDKHLLFDFCHLLFIKPTMKAVNRRSLHTSVNPTEVLSPLMNSLIAINYCCKSYCSSWKKNKRIQDIYVIDDVHSTTLRNSCLQSKWLRTQDINRVLTLWRRMPVPTKSCHLLVSWLNCFHACHIRSVYQLSIWWRWLEQY